MRAGNLRQRFLQAVTRTDFTWRYVIHCRSALDHRLRAPAPRGAAARVLTTLRRDGIAVLPAAELFGPSGLAAPLIAAAEELETAWAPRLGELREAYRSGAATGKQKRYSIPLLPDGAPAPGGIFTAFALQPPLVEVANAYFGMYTVLTHCNVWHNFMASGQPEQSQLWHRDPEDRHILKVFFYLSDVGEGAGPFTYARGTHRTPSKVAPHSRVDGGTPRSTDEELARLAPRACWLAACGPRGTLVLADTRGYHKGGWGASAERIVYVCEFLASGAKGIDTRENPLRRAAGV